MLLTRHRLARALPLLRVRLKTLPNRIRVDASLEHIIDFDCQGPYGCSQRMLRKGCFAKTQSKSEF